MPYADMQLGSCSRSPHASHVHVQPHIRSVATLVGCVAPSPWVLWDSFASSPLLASERRRAASKRGVLAVLGSVLQRRVLALADVEGAPVRLGPVRIAHFRGRLPALQRRLLLHYARQTLQALYRVSPWARPS